MIYYFPNGKLFSEEIYVDGKLEGQLKNYFKNGKILESGSYSQLASKRNGYFTDTLQIEKMKSKK